MRRESTEERQEVKLYSCTVCSNNYGSSRQLKVHEKTHAAAGPSTNHEDVNMKPFVCEECNKSFAAKGLLMQHKRTHGERRFECSSCHMGFKFAHHLKTHMNIHSGTRPYSCSECDRRFTQIHVVRNHMLKEHGKMPYTCTACGTDFPNLQTFKQHETCCPNMDEPPVIVDPSFGQAEDDEDVADSPVIVNLAVQSGVYEPPDQSPLDQSKDQGPEEASEPRQDTEESRDQSLSEITIKNETIETKEN